MTEPLRPPSDPFETTTASSQPPAPPANPGPPPAYAQPGAPATGQSPYGQPLVPGQAYQPYAQQPSVTPGMPVSAPPTGGYPTQYPTSGVPGQPGYPSQGQPGFPAGQPGAEPPKKKSKAPMIIGIVLGVLLLVCGGGGVGVFLYFKNTVDPLGAGYESPTAATEEFLNAFYTEKDAAAAEKTVCKAARDKKDIKAQIDRIAGYDDAYRSPKFTWEITIGDETAESATATVKLTMNTSDEKQSAQQLALTVINDNGWRVCEVQ